MRARQIAKTAKRSFDGVVLAILALPMSIWTVCCDEWSKPGPAGVRIGGAIVRSVACVALYILAGLSGVNQLSWSIRKRVFGVPHWDWSPWFAWRPVFVDGRFHWLTTVLRRPTSSANSMPFNGWSYRVTRPGADC